MVRQLARLNSPALAAQHAAVDDGEAPGPAERSSSGRVSKLKAGAVACAKPSSQQNGKALLSNRQQAARTAQPQHQPVSNMRASLQAPLAGPEMFTPLPTATEVGRSRNNHQQPVQEQQHEDRQTGHYVQQLRLVQQLQKLQQRHKQQKQQIVSDRHAALSPGSKPSGHPGVSQQDTDPSAQHTALQLTQDLQQQLRVLEKQRQLQERYQLRASNQQYALRARTPSPHRSSSPTQLPPRSQSPPRQLAGAPVSNRTAAASHAAVGPSGGGFGAAPRAAADASRAAQAKGAGALQNTAAAALSRPTTRSAGTDAEQQSNQHIKASSARAAAPGTSAAAGTRAGGVVGTGTSSRGVLSKGSNSAGLSLRPNSKASAYAGVSSRYLSSTTSSDKAAKAAAAAGSASSQRQQNSTNSAPLAGRSSAATAGSGGGVRGQRTAQPADTADKSAARTAVAAAIAAAESKSQRALSSQVAGDGSAGAAAAASAAGHGAASATAKAAAAAAVGQLTRGSKLQQLKHCNQRLRQSLQQQQQLQQQLSDSWPAGVAARGESAAELPTLRTWGGAGVAAANRDAAGQQMPEQVDWQDVDESIQQQDWQQQQRQQQRQSYQHGDMYGPAASEVAGLLLDRSSCDSSSSSDDSGSECSDAAHDLEHWQQQQKQQQTGAYQELLSEASDCSSSSPSKWQRQLQRQQQEEERVLLHVLDTEPQGTSAAASRSASGDLDSGSSISFMAGQLHGVLGQQEQGLLQSQQSQQQVQQQQQEGVDAGQEEEEAGEVDWPPRQRLRTALFASPTPNQQQRHNRRQRSPHTDHPSSSRGSSPACSWVEEDLEDAAEEAEHQMQLLLNNTATKGPESPSWACVQQPRSQAAGVHVAASTAAAGQRHVLDSQHSSKDVARQHVAKQQQQQQQQQGGGRGQGPKRDPGQSMVHQQQQGPGGIQGLQSVLQAVSQPGLQPVLQPVLMQTNSASGTSGLHLSTAEEDFLQLLEGMDGPQQQRQQQQQHTEGVTSPQGVLQQPPWRPPGTTPSISSPPPPVCAERGGGGGSRGKQQQQRQRRAGSSSRSRSPPHAAAVAAAAAAAAVRSFAHVEGPVGRAHRPADLRAMAAPGWEAPGGAGSKELQQIHQQLQQQQQQQPVSYQRQLQAYLNTQHEQPHHDSDQQQTDQQHGKHWPPHSSSSPKGYGSSPKAPSSSTKTAAAAVSVARGRSNSKAAHQNSSEWSPQQQQQLRCRLSLPESCDGSDIEVDWAAAALEAAVAAGACDGAKPAAGVPAAAAGVYGHAQPAAAEAAAAVEDPDAVVEEFAAMLETRHSQQRWDAPDADQAASVVVDQPQLLAWGSRVDAGWLNSSSNSGSSRGVAGLGPSAQLQQQLGVRLASQLAGGMGLQEGCQSEQELQELRAAIDSTLLETAAAFRRYSLLRRTFNAWSRDYVAAARAQNLRRDASAAAADAFAAARQYRLLSHCWSGWTAAVVVGGSARSAGTQLLQRCVRRQVLADWRGVVVSSREAKQQVLRAWNAQVQEHQADQLQMDIASLHNHQQVLHKAWRAWVVTWCKAASARVLSEQIDARRKAAVLAAFSDNVRHQQHKRGSVVRAEIFRRARLLLLCVRWWKGYARYSQVLQSAGAAVQAGARARVLEQVVTAWREHVGYRAWKAEASEAVQGFYWSRLATTALRAWHQMACDSSTSAATAAAAGGFAAERQRRLLVAVTQEWWVECVGNRRAFEMQVQSLVKLVAAAFRAWRQLAATQQQQEQAKVTDSSMPAESANHQQGVEEGDQDDHQGSQCSSGSSGGGNSSKGSLITQYTRRLERQQQQQHSSSSNSQQQDQAHQDAELLRQALTGWCGYVGLRKMWRYEAPVLAAAYYQGKLLKRTWGAWVASLQQLQQHGYEGGDGVDREQEWVGHQGEGERMQQQQLFQQQQRQQQQRQLIDLGATEVTWSQEADCRESFDTAESVRGQQYAQLQLQPEQQQQPGQQHGGMAEGVCGEESYTSQSTAPGPEPSLQEILMGVCTDVAAMQGHTAQLGPLNNHHHHQQQQCEVPGSTAAAGAADCYPGAVAESQGSWDGDVPGPGSLDATAASVRRSAAATKAEKSTKQQSRAAPDIAVMFVAAEADVDAWRSWQQQQYEKQHEAVQTAAAEQHRTAYVLRKTFTAWFATAAAGAALMSQQAQLKHAAQLQLLQTVKQQQLAAVHVRERLLERPFRTWSQVVLLKGSAAAGFRSYQLLFKAFLGWREVVVQRRQHQQQREQQREQQQRGKGRQQQPEDVCLSLQPLQPRVPVVDKQGTQQQQQQQQQWKAWDQQLRLQEQPAAVSAAETGWQQHAPALTPAAAGNPASVPGLLPACPAATATPGTARTDALAAAAAAASGPGVLHVEDLMAPCQPLQLEDSACSMQQHSLGALELTASEAAFAEQHESMSERDWSAAKHGHAQAQRVHERAHQGHEHAAVAVGGWPGARSFSGPTPVVSAAGAAGVLSTQQKPAAWLQGSGTDVAGVLQSPPGSCGGCDPAAAGALYGGRLEAGAAASANANVRIPAATGQLIAARLAAVLQQRQQAKLLQQQQAEQQQQPVAAQPQQQKVSSSQQQQQQQGCDDVEGDISSSFGDFSCLQDLQSLLDGAK